METVLHSFLKAKSTQFITKKAYSWQGYSNSFCCKSTFHSIPTRSFCSGLPEKSQSLGRRWRIWRRSKISGETEDKLFFSGLTIAGALLCLNPISTLLRCKQNIAYGKQSLEWNKTTATVTSTDVVRSWMGRSWYRPSIEYKYTVNGQEYKGNRLNFSEQAFNSKEKAEQELRGYKQGRRIYIFYDPQNPNNSVVFNGPRDQSNQIIQGVAGLFVFGGISALGIVCMRLKKPSGPVYRMVNNATARVKQPSANSNN